MPRQLQVLRWLLLGMLVAGLSLPAVPAQAQSGAPLWAAGLDCSGSTLTTDPEGYSISAASLLTETTAPARLLLIFFCGSGNGGVTVAGPYDLADPSGLAAARKELAQRQQLRGERTGGTPLAAMLETATEQFTRLGAPKGSALTLFSDGEPEPDPEGQLARVAQLTPEWRQHGWKIATVGLGSANSPWLGRLASIAADTAGPARNTTNPAELIAVFAQQWADLVGYVSPRLRVEALPGSGSLIHAFTLDPTVRETLVVATRRSPATMVQLADASRRLVAREDPRVRAYYDADPHFVFILLRDKDPLGSGEWQLRFSGPAGDPVGSALSFSGRFTIGLVSPPPNSLLPVDQKLSLSFQLLDGDKPLLRGDGRVTALLTTPAGKAITVNLQDDGQQTSGDETRGDGNYSGVLTLPEPGTYRWQVEATVDGAKVPETAGLLYADYFPRLVALPLEGLRPVKPDTVVSLEVARLMAGPGAIGARSITKVDLIVSNAANEQLERRSLSPQEAFRGSLLTISLTPRLADVAANDLAAGGVFPAIYQVKVRLTGTYRNQPFTDDNAASFPVRVPLEVEQTWLNKLQALAVLAWALLQARSGELQTLLAALMPLASVLWLRQRAAATARLVGVLTGQSARSFDRQSAARLHDLQTLNAAVAWHRRLRLARVVWADASALGPQFAGLSFGATANRQGASTMWVRLLGNSAAKLNGVSLSPASRVLASLAPVVPALVCLLLAAALLAVRAAANLPVSALLTVGVALPLGLVLASALPLPLGLFGWHQLPDPSRLEVNSQLFAYTSTRSPSALPQIGAGARRNKWQS